MPTTPPGSTVIIQLTTHTEGLRRELNSLASRLSGISEERQRAGDERSEAELRAHVGELSPSDWENTAAASDARLAELAERHGEVERELQKTRDLLESAQRPATPATSAPAAPRDAEKVAASADVAESVPSPVATEPTAPDVAAAAPAAPPSRAASFRVIHQAPSPGGCSPIEQHALDMDDAPIANRRPASGCAELDAPAKEQLR